MLNTVTEIDRPSPGSWWIGDLDIANHEAAHAVVATMLGREVIEERIDRPSDEQIGFSKTTLDHEATMADLENALLSTLAGPHAGGTPLDLPPEESDETTDAQNAKSLGLILGLTSTDWHIVGLRLELLLERPATRRAIRAVGTALRERGALSGAEVRRLVEEAKEG
jgi:hypothetical protein